MTGPAPTPAAFLCGASRSGTTLLRAMLDSHPDVAVPPEATFVVRMLRERRHYESDGAVKLDELTSDLTRNRQFQLWEIGTVELRDALRAEQPRTVPDALSVLYRMYAAKHDAPFVIDKTPYNVRWIPRLAEAFPGARFVHLVRDGRNVAPAMLAARLHRDQKLPEALMMWQEDVSEGRRSGVALGDERYLEIRYETLVAEPEPTLRSLCSFLGIEFDPAMLRYHERADQLPGGPSSPQGSAVRGEIHANLHQPPNPEIRKFVDEVSPRDLSLLEALAGHLLVELGYKLTQPPPDVRVRARAAAWKLRRLTMVNVRYARSSLRYRIGNRRARRSGPEDQPPTSTP